jgi:hypothetical protein
MIMRLPSKTTISTVVMLFVIPIAASVAQAEATHIDVRVLSKGAKFVGTSMGGVAVTIADADTGEILAKGVTSGSTGDTARIMKDQIGHHAPVSTGDSAVFHATIDIDEPQRVRITATGPLAQAQASNTVSATQWIVPGKDVTGGDGFLLELPGLVVDVLAPPAHVKLASGTHAVRVEANVTMMCGCPIEPGGIWDASSFQVAAIVRRNGKRVGEVPLEYAGSTSQFAATIETPEAGSYELTVYVHQPSTGNTGLDRTTFIVP